MAKYMRLRLADMLARETGRLRTTEAVLRLQIKETNMRDNGKMVKKMDLEYIHYLIGVNISVSIRKD